MAGLLWMDNGHTEDHEETLVVGTLTPAEVASETETPELCGPLEGRAACDACLHLFEKGTQLLKSVSDFRGTFFKQERIGGELLDREEVQIKMRHEPMSVYMRWNYPFTGREVIWEQESNDGKLLIHEYGLRGRLVPLVKIAPDSPLVTAGTLRPIDQAGLWAMADQLRSRRHEIELDTVEASMTDDVTIGGRPCYRFCFRHPQPREDVQFHMTVVYIDKDWNLPVGCEGYGWPTSDCPEPPLECAYFYTDLVFDTGLGELDFDIKNPAYQYTRKPSQSVQR